MLRRTAITSARTRIRISAMKKSWTFTQNAAAMSGSDSAKSAPLKKDCWTSGQPDELTATQARTPKKTNVLANAIAVDRSAPWPERLDRRPRPGGSSTSPRSRGPRPPRAVIDQRRSASGLEDRRVRLVRQPGLGDLVERPVRLEGADRLVHAARERAPLGQDPAEMLRVRAGLDGKLPDDGGERVALRVDDLGRRDVERGREVHHETVDLLGLERLHRGVVVVVDRDAGRGLDDVL